MDPTNRPDNTIAISNSDTKTWICKRKFWYAYGVGITPKAKGLALSKGTFGHSLLERWYIDKSIKAVGDEYNKKVMSLDAYDNPDFAAKDMAHIYHLVMEYLNYYYGGDPARVPEIKFVEQEFELDLTPYINDIQTTNKLVFRFKPDLIWVDPDTKKLAVVDHKFVYDFAKPNAIALDTQLPKYITALTQLGVDVHYGMLNQLRTRKVSTEKFNRELLMPSRTQYETVWEDHITAAREITEWFNSSLTEKAQSPRCYSTMVCRMCNYADLCVAELQGQDQVATELIANEYEVYQYGKKTMDALTRAAAEES